MIYAEITYTGKKDKEGQREFYLLFHGDKKLIERDMWIKHIEKIFEATKGDVFHDIYFTGKGPAYIKSRETVLGYLAERKFMPATEDFFYKK